MSFRVPESNPHNIDQESLQFVKENNIKFYLVIRLHRNSADGYQEFYKSNIDNSQEYDKTNSVLYLYESKSYEKDGKEFVYWMICKCADEISDSGIAQKLDTGLFKDDFDKVVISDCHGNPSDCVYEQNSSDNDSWDSDEQSWVSHSWCLSCSGYPQSVTNVYDFLKLSFTFDSIKESSILCLKPYFGDRVDMIQYFKNIMANDSERMTLNEYLESRKE